jgi:hypothetical protein
VGKLDEIENPELKVYNSLVTTSLFGNQYGIIGSKSSI